MSLAAKYGLLHIPSGIIVETSYGSKWLENMLLAVKKKNEVTLLNYSFHSCLRAMGLTVHSVHEDEFEIILLEPPFDNHAKDDINTKGATT